MPDAPRSSRSLWQRIIELAASLRARVEAAMDDRRVLRQVNQALILVFVAALLWGVLRSEWRTVLIHARYL
jgi:hypothetical protein